MKLKLEAFLLMSLLLLVLCMPRSYASELQQSKPVTLSYKTTNLNTLLTSIMNQSGVRILFDVTSVKNIEKTNVDLKNVSVEEALKEVLENTGFGYELIDGALVVKKVPVPQQKKVVQPQKPEKVTGKITDSNGEPLTGVSIIIKGTKSAAISDLNGNYSITLTSPANSVLSFSFIGMKEKEVRYNGQNIDVVMEENADALSEVVVTGYFERSRDSYTGSATTYSREQLHSVSNQNMLTTLSMVDPTFRMVENIDLGSDPNTVPDFQIRGKGNINDLVGEYSSNPNMPTFILDGFEVSSTKIFDLDPNRISSITLLKDAAATAIYGSRAANGVVVVETKAPAEGKIKVSYNFNMDFEVADLSDYNLMNASEKLQYEKLANLYDWNQYIYIKDDYYENYNERLAMVAKGYDTDWISKPVRKLGVGNKNSLSFEGGNKSFLYSIDAAYYDQVGALKGSGRTRMGIGANFQYNYKNVKFKSNITFDNVKYENSPYGDFSEYTYVNPYLYPYDENGKLKDVLIFYNGRSFASKPEYNPLYNASLNNKDEGKYDNFINNFSVDWAITEGLRLKGNFSINKMTTITDKFLAAEHTDFYNSELKGSYTKGTNESIAYDGSTVLSYSKSVDKHFFNATAVYNIKETTMDSYSTTAYGYPNSNMDHIGMGVQYKDGDNPSGFEATSRLMGFVGNFNYNYDKRFLVDCSVRSDASSLFGSNKRWGTFGSVGIGWNINREKFMENVEWVSLLKLRGSWGLTGGQNFYAYQALMTYTYKDQSLSNVTYNNQVGALLKAFGNNNLKWQKTEKKNIGLDFELFNRKLFGTVNFYSDISKDVLIDVTMAPSLGFPTYKENLGQVKNSGFEISLRSCLIQDTKRDFSLNLFFNGTSNKNKLMEINDALRAYNDNSDANIKTRPMVRYMEGESINTIWANKSLGIDPATGEEIFLDLNGERVNKWSSANYQPLGCSDPKLEGNFGTTINFKGFQLATYFSFSYGGQTYNQTLLDKVENVDPYRNTDKRALYNRWKQPGDIAAYKSISNTTITYPTSRFIEDYNVLKFSSLNLSYQFDSAKMERLGLERCKVSLIGNDIFRSSTVKAERGISYPYARHFSLALQLTF